MKGFRRTAVVAVVVAGFVAAPVLAYGDGSIALDLVATPTLKAQLRSAFLAAHPGVAPSEVGSPFPGRTYYRSYSDVPYAVATFSITGAPAYPTVFKMDRRGRWHVRRQTHGGVCTDVVPLELIKVWWLQHWSGRCYVLPR